MLIGYSGDVTRFATAGHFAAYNGTAPIEFSSSGRTVHRLSRRGNRTLNHAIHMIAVTQIRHPGSEGRAYYDRKLAEGRTRREARRSLKRHISNRVYRHLARRRSSAARPGRTTRGDSHIQRGRPNPERRHFGSVTPGPNTNDTPRRTAASRGPNRTRLNVPLTRGLLM